MIITLYRIVDVNTNTTVADSIEDYDFARETLHFYTLDYPNTRFEIESYTRNTVKPGFGRDPDLHT